MKRPHFVKLLALLPLFSNAMKINILNELSNPFSSSPTMPLLFVGHGSLMNAIEENECILW